MRILYCAYYHDPSDPDAGSGADFNFLQALRAQGHEVRIAGPIKVNPCILERFSKKVYEKITQKKYIKYYLSDIWRYQSLLKRELRDWTPDLIFSIFAIPFIFLNKQIPCIFRMDAPILGVKKEYVNYGNFSKSIFVWMEKAAFRNVRLIITHSEWAKNILIKEYHVPPQKIHFFPNPCAIKKAEVTTETKIQNKTLKLPLKLLAVGRDYQAKGIDIAVKTIESLAQKGYPAQLTVCGISKDSENKQIQYKGWYQKKNTLEYQTYLSHFAEADFFLHPTLYDASPIVTSEAAAFGLPVITNLVGGMGTSVLHGETGVVLPYQSSPEVYANAIIDLYKNENKYHEMAMASFKRFQSKLNWEDASHTLNNLLQSAIESEEKRAAGKTSVKR